ncbi:thioester reductase domain-containing protein [Actinokineospora sp. 24-640]
MSPPAVLLTGATGFLGGAICAELLRDGDTTVHCLVRGASDTGALARLRRHVSAYLLGEPVDERRLVVVRGDVTAARLGLPAPVYQELATTVGAVYHCAGSVNLAAEYDSLAPTNVGGTRNVLAFARHRGDKAVHHVSSAAVFLRAARQRRRVVREDTLPTRQSSDVVGYTRTKWVAEAEVRRAGLDGLPVAIYRPGLVLGHSTTGAFSDTELSVRLIRGAIAVGRAPTTDCEVPAAPVDHIARAVIALSRRPEAIGHAWHPNVPLPIASVFAHAGSLGYPLPACTVEQWRQALLGRADQLSAYLVLAVWELMRYLLVPTEQYRPPAVDCTATNDLLARCSVTPPELGERLFGTIIRRIAADGLVPSPPHERVPSP